VALDSCDCWGNVFDCGGTCGGHKDYDECGVCDGHGVDWIHGECDCNGNVIDECGVCGGNGVLPGWVDCYTESDVDNTHTVFTFEDFK
jgi:hypothetical protein